MQLSEIIFQKPAPKPEGQKRYLLEHYKDDEYILAIDHSSISLFNDCDRKSLWALIHSRVAPRSSALTYGSAIHKSLEAYYRGQEDFLNAGITEFLENPPSVLEWRNENLYRQTMESYVAKYSKEDTFKILEHEGHKLIECPFREPLCTLEINGSLAFLGEVLLAAWPTQSSTNSPYISKLHIIWTGVIDLVIQDGDRTFICDHKTTSIEGDSYWKQFELSSQFLGYVWAAQRLLGRNIDGALANVIYSREPAKTAAGLKAQRDKQFMRRYFLYRPDQVSEWQSNMTHIMEDFCHNLVTGNFPMKTNHCTNKYGTCPYHDVCSQPDEMRLTALKTNLYSNNVWNPLT